MTEVASNPEGIKVILNDTLEDYFKEPKHMVSAENLMSYPYWTTSFTVHTNASDKQLGALISQNNKKYLFILNKTKKSTT